MPEILFTTQSPILDLDILILSPKELLIISGMIYMDLMFYFQLNNDTFRYGFYLPVQKHAKKLNDEDDGETREEDEAQRLEAKVTLVVYSRNVYEHVVLKFVLQNLQLNEK